ncbi:hypothetical protein K431DRAFT_18572 [Polychaeton citri CBS 116435]|uniref:Uncharacterized protein n=1 Tax=Polychaeton citri CBS 116435 TaxID=1314669 RepID=A0A9P4PZ37_9PEZI|nr:hypothetical protein K431DRAFT_18572 [Polychaeton citri CBS 116435]
MTVSTESYTTLPPHSMMTSYDRGYKSDVTRQLDPSDPEKQQRSFLLPSTRRDGLNGIQSKHLGRITTIILVFSLSCAFLFITTTHSESQSSTQLRADTMSTEPCARSWS